MTAPAQKLYRCPVCSAEYHLETPLTLPSGVPGLVMTPCTVCMARVLNSLGVGNLEEVVNP